MAIDKCEVADIVVDQYRISRELGVLDDAAPASFIARRAPRIAAVADDVAAKFQGRIQGGVGDIVERASQLESAVREAARETAEPLVRSLDRVLTRALDDMRYVGPDEFAEAANGAHRGKVWASTPREYWENVPTKLYDDLDKLRALSTERKVIAEQLGYPESPFIENYARQEWEEVDEAVRLFSDQKVGTLIGPAKKRVLPNYAIGINAGLTPTEKSVGELMSDAISLWSRAVGEGFERKLVLARYGTKGGKALTSGKANFRHPLYRGFSADRDVVNAVEGYHVAPGKTTRAIVDVAATAKNTAFGPLDIAVSGLQGLKALTTGGVQLFAASVLRGATALKIAPAQRWRALIESSEGLPFLVDAANNGLVLSSNVGAVTTGQGTVFKYFGPLGKAINKPLSAFIDAKARVEFGMVLNWIRLELYKGNLLLLHMSGQDITDAAVRKTAANWANAMSGASRGAQTPGRRAVETAATTSYNMMRSEIATLGGIVKAATVGSGTEKLMAMMTLASVGATVYGIGSVINMTFGNGPIEFNPQNGKWATIQIGGKNVPIIPQRGLVRAIAKSITELEKLSEADTNKLTQIWSQYILSKGAPGTVSPAANLAGFGFDPDRGFETGTLERKWRYLNALPLPPVLSAALAGEVDPVSVGFGLGGFNPFPVSGFDRLKEAFEEKAKAGEFGPEYRQSPEYDTGRGDKQLAKGDPELSALLEQAEKEGVEGGFEGAVSSQEREEQLAQKEQSLNLPDIAQRLSQGNIESGPAFVLAMEDLYRTSANFAARDFFGVDFDDPENEQQQNYRDWAEMSPSMFPDPVTGGPDMNAFFEAKDITFDKLPKALQTAIKKRLKTSDPIVQEWEAKYKAAKEIRGDLYDTVSQVNGLSVSAHRQIREFMDVVRRARAYWLSAEGGGREVSVEDAVAYLASRQGKSDGFTKWAQALRGGIPDRLRNHDWTAGVIKNLDTFRMFWPQMITRFIGREAVGIPQNIPSGARGTRATGATAGTAATAGTR